MLEEGPLDPTPSLGTTPRTWPQLPRKPPIKKTKQGEENPSLLRLVVENRVPVCKATSQHQALDKAGWRPGFRSPTQSGTESP